MWSWQKIPCGLALSSLLQNDDIVLLSPRVFGGNGEQEFLCKRYPSVLVLFLRGFAPRFVRRLFHRRLAAYEMRDLCSGEQQVDVAIASGCFMLVRTSALRAVSGFNDEFFLYFEDFDLSLRLGTAGSSGLRSGHAHCAPRRLCREQGPAAPEILHQLPRSCFLIATAGAGYSRV